MTETAFDGFADTYGLAAAPPERENRDTTPGGVADALHRPELHRGRRRSHDDDTAELLGLVRQVMLAQVQKSTQLIELLAGQALNGVLESATVRLSADGSSRGRSYRVPFAAVFVINQTGGDLTVSAGPRGLTPSGGAGVVVLQAGWAAVVPLVGDVLTFQGPAGGRLVFATFSRPVDPFATGPAPNTRPVPAAAGQMFTGPGAIRGEAVYESTGLAGASLLIYDSIGAPSGAPILPITLAANESTRDELPGLGFTNGLWAVVTGAVGGVVLVGGAV